MLAFIEPDWPAPPGIGALSTIRQGGVSEGIYSGLNLGDHVEDNPVAVASNRAQLLRALPRDTAIQWLDQVHGVTVIEATADPDVFEADAAWTRTPGVACAVMTADCLPVLFCDRAGTVVAAAHAGWRGLLSGVLENAVASMSTPPGQILAWLGPAIGQDAFEVGAEVYQQFLAVPDAIQPQVARCFRESGAEGKYLADLYGLARQRLSSQGVTGVYGGDYCTYSDPERFYSYRRDGQTGRMASLIWLNHS